MYLLEDRPEMAFVDPVVGAGGLLAVTALGCGLWSRSRLRRRPRRGPAYDVFRQDAASSLVAWGAIQLALAAGWLARVEGLRMPVWSYLGLAIGIAILAFVWRRERAPWPALAKNEEDEVLPDGRVQRGTSQTWEMGFLAGGGLAIASYLFTAGHEYGHPIHWVTTGLSFLAGYGLGLAIWSPRFKLAVVRARRPSAAQRRTAAVRGKPINSKRTF